MEFVGSPVKREGGGRGVVAASALPYSRETALERGGERACGDDSDKEEDPSVAKP